MSKPKDCTVIESDERVIISKSTAYEALEAMRKCANDGKYKGLFADDASFIRASMEELEKATSQ